MIRSSLHGLFALIAVGVFAAAPVACQSGGVGDPCTPEAEYDTQFPGFKVGQDFIESRSFQCSTRVCLVNHFQGRVSCPAGQSTMTPCSGLEDTSCGGDAKCVESAVVANDCDCDASKPGDCVAACGGQAGISCDPKLKMCMCSAPQQINGVDFYCNLVDPKCQGATCARVLKSYVCHKPGNCQTTDGKDNEGKDCCVPGTDKPVAVPVCGQCNSKAKRDADNSVYCSCRCCPKCCKDLEPGSTEPCEKDETICGEACDPNFNYCSCPTGFTCSKIRPRLGLGDDQLTGAYCIKEGTEFKNEADCGDVAGYWDPQTCAGTAGN